MHMATFSFNLLTDGRVSDPDLIAPVSQHLCDPLLAKYCLEVWCRSSCVVRLISRACREGERRCPSECMFES